ncbi:hypothetical protein FNYG_15357 [Fusarium nygamai]|uniref:Uncharacterized protein n=1 Tax=Gibberella nygamai TaxID=42673 RepID=A0A2K0UF52_GIBNY|nr:hypothetical protein FNYG_15357 [Fusarium nygamai]
MAYYAPIWFDSSPAKKTYKDLMLRKHAENLIYPQIASYLEILRAHTPEAVTSQTEALITLAFRS